MISSDGNSDFLDYEWDEEEFWTTEDDEDYEESDYLDDEDDE